MYPCFNQDNNFMFINVPLKILRNADVRGQYLRRNSEAKLLTQTEDGQETTAILINPFSNQSLSNHNYEKMAEKIFINKEFGRTSIGRLVDSDHLITLLVAMQTIQPSIQNLKSLREIHKHKKHHNCSGKNQGKTAKKS